VGSAGTAVGAGVAAGAHAPRAIAAIRTTAIIKDIFLNIFLLLFV